MGRFGHGVEISCTAVGARRRALFGQALDAVHARLGTRLHAREGDDLRRHRLRRQLQPLAFRRAERRERARDRGRRPRRAAGDVRGRSTGTVSGGGAVKRLVVLVAALALSGSSAQALRLPSAPRCTIFPKTNAWNTRVDALPVASNSDAIIQSIGTSVGVHADFGSGLYDGGVIGIPFDVVTKKTPRTTRITFEYSDESDHVGYPIPTNVHIESGSDHHALLLDKDACRLYELGGLARNGRSWTAWAGATWNLRGNKVRPA